MADTFRETAEKLGAEYVGDVPEVGSGAFGAALLAKILQERLEPGQGKRPGRPTDPRWTYRHRHVPMSAETLRNLDLLVEQINRRSARKVSKTQVAAVLLEKAIARELASAGSGKE